MKIHLSWNLKKFLFFLSFPSVCIISSPPAVSVSFSLTFQYPSQLLSPALFALAGWAFVDEGKGTFGWPIYQIISYFANSGGGSPNALVLNLCFRLYLEAAIGCWWLCCCVSVDRCTQIQEVIQILYDFFYPQRDFLQRKQLGCFLLVLG